MALSQQLRAGGSEAKEFLASDDGAGQGAATRHGAGGPPAVDSFEAGMHVSGEHASVALPLISAQCFSHTAQTQGIVSLHVPTLWLARPCMREHVGALFCMSTVGLPGAGVRLPVCASSQTFSQTLRQSQVMWMVCAVQGRVLAEAPEGGNVWATRLGCVCGPQNSQLVGLCRVSGVALHCVETGLAGV